MKKKDIQSFSRFITAALVLMSAVACDDHSDHLTTDDPPSQRGSIEGIVAPSVYGNASKVCVDKDKDYRCGDHEPQAVPDEFGKFAIQSDPGLVVAELYTDDDADRPSNIMIGGVDNGYFISPLTTLMYVHAEMNSRSLEEAEADIRSRIQMPDDTQSLSENYLATGDALSKGLAKAVSSYQSKRFKLASESVSKSLQVEVVEGFLSSSIDLSDAKAVAALENGGPTGDGDAGGSMGAIPDLTDVPIIQGMRLGAGYDVLSDRVKSASQCVVSKGVSEDSAEIRQKESINRNEIRYEYNLITNREDLVDFLDINSNIDVTGNAFDVSIGFKMLKNYEKHSNKIYAAVKIDARIADIAIDKPALTPGAEYLFGNDYQTFRKLCGDQFLDVITVGGVYYGLIEMEAKTAEDKLNIEAALKVKVDTSSVKVDVGFDMILRKAFNTAGQDVKVTIYSAGAPSGFQPVTDFTSFILDVTHFYCNLRGVSPEDCEVIAAQKLQSLGEQNATLDSILEQVNNIPTAPPTIVDPNIVDSEGNITGAIQHAVYAKFEDYGQILNSLRESDIVTLNYNKRQLLEHYNAYYSLLEQVNDMVNFPTLYVDMNDDAEAKIRELRNNLPVYLENIKLLLADCGRPIEPECVAVTDKESIWKYIFGESNPPENGYDKTDILPTQIRRTLPALKDFLPRTCLDIRNKGVTAENSGQFVLYLGGDEQRPFWAECRNINSAIALPEDYLRIENRSVLQDDGFGKLRELPNYNYSIFKELPKPKMNEASIVPEVGDGGVPDDTEGLGNDEDTPQATLSKDEYNELNTDTLISAYQMIKILINQDSIVIDPNQKAYAGITEDAVPGTAVSEAPTVVNHGPASVAEYRPIYGQDFFHEEDNVTYDLVGVYNHAPLGWTKVCDRNLLIGNDTVLEDGVDGYDIRRTANINLKGTPFTFRDDFTMETNTRFEPMYNVLDGLSAYNSALGHGGKLLVLMDQNDADHFASILQRLGFDGVWLNLQYSDEGPPGSPYFVPDWGVDVVQFNPFGDDLEPEWEFMCSYLSVVTTDVGVQGKIDMRSCDEIHPYFIEYSKADVGYEMGDTRQTLDIHASHIYGDCVTVYPAREMVLEYNSDLAVDLELVDPDETVDEYSDRDSEMLVDTDVDTDADAGNN